MFSDGSQQTKMIPFPVADVVFLALGLSGIIHGAIGFEKALAIIFRRPIIP
jgi:hypothetical protein